MVEERTATVRAAEAEPAARADLYAVLSACFAPPSAGLAEAAATGALARAVRDAVERLPFTWRRLEASAAAFASLPGEMGGDRAAALRALEVEYARLFVGPGMPAVPPYESTYADRDVEYPDVPGPLWGSATYGVRAAYAAAGMAYRGGPEPPDHLAAELEFVAFLSEREAEALARGDGAAAAEARRRRRAFLAGHLRRWGLQAAGDTAARAGHPLYRAAGRLLATVLAAEG